MNAAQIYSEILGSRFSMIGYIARRIFSYDYPLFYGENHSVVSNFEKAPENPPIGSKKKARKTQERPDANTFSDLLDDIDDVYESLDKKEIDTRWLTRRELDALRSIGTYVPSPWEIDFYDKPILPASEILPTIAAASFVGRRHNKEDVIHANMIYAIKDAVLPVGIERIPGTVYRFGLCVELPEKEGDKNSELRTFWIWAYTVVKPNGEIAIPRINEKTTCYVPSISAKRNGFMGGKIGIPTSQWKKQTILTRSPEDIALQGGISDAKWESHLLSEFRQLILWWNRRNQLWSVAIRKNGKRITFSVDPKHTSAYFADRGKQATENGKTKRIIHFVSPHTRRNGSEVKAHVRGLREFDWRGYQCFVTAPNLTGWLPSAEFALNPVDVDLSEDDPTPPGMLDVLDVVHKITDIEDYQDGRYQSQRGYS